MKNLLDNILKLENCDVLVCEPIEILSEHRVYVHKMY